MFFLGILLTYIFELQRTSLHYLLEKGRRRYIILHIIRVTASLFTYHREYIRSYANNNDQSIINNKLIK